MPKVNVYLPDELATAVRDAGVPVSAVCQRALADAVAATDASATAGDGGRLARFTQRARTVVERAEASGADDPTSVDVLAGILEEGNNLALMVLTAVDIEPPDLVAEAEAALTAGRGAEPAASPAPLGDVLTRAGDEADSLGHNYVGTEHLLLGLAGGPRRDPVVTALATMGARKQVLRVSVVSALAGMAHARSSTPTAALSAPVRSVLEEIRQRLNHLEGARTGP